MSEVSTGRASEWHESPIAPAAVSETGFNEWWLDNVNNLRIEAEEADEDDGLFCARAAWNAAYIRQKLKSVSSQTASAEGDGWIAVTERMPEMGVWVWVYAISTALDWSESFFQTSGKLQGVSDSGEVYFSTVNAGQFPVTHWRPLLTSPSVLPAPPEEGAMNLPVVSDEFQHEPDCPCFSEQHSVDCANANASAAARRRAGSVLAGTGIAAHVLPYLLTLPRKERGKSDGLYRAEALSSMPEVVEPLHL